MKLVPTYENSEIYIDADGQPWKKLPVHKDSNGYPMTKVNNRSVRMHTLICLAHHGEPAIGQGVRHLDGDVQNNDPSNLAWGTQAENMQDAVKHGTHYTGAKITNEQRLEIISRRSAGESLKSIALDVGLSIQRVCDLSKGRYKKQGTPA